MYLEELKGIELTQFWVCKFMIPLKYSLDMSGRQLSIQAWSSEETAELAMR